MEVFDYIVVGAGSAGCVLANRLSADPRCSVLLIEAGGPDNDPLVRMPLGFLQALVKPSLTWVYESEPEPHLGGRRHPMPRGRLLGGSSSINGMVHIRGHRLDFDDWAAMGCTGWGYEDVLPCFRRSETHWQGAGRYHGAEGPVQVRAVDTTRLLFEPLRDAALACGHRWSDDYDGADGEGIAKVSVAIDGRGRRSSTARAYLHPVLSRPNLSVQTHSHVQRVVIDNGQATGVDVLRDGLTRRVQARREVVLCGGAYNSPQLLMLSGIGPGEHLQSLGVPVLHDLPGVGANLMEHPRMPMEFAASRPGTFNEQLRFDRAALSVLRWALWGSGPFANQICTANILLRSSPSVDRPDLQLICSPVQVDAHVWFPGIRAPKPHGFYISVCQLYPKSRGRLTLRSADPMAPPRILLNLYEQADDFAVMRAGIRATRRLYATPPQAELVQRENLPGAAHLSDAELDEAIRQHATITHHPAGTCAMGTGAAAVVDPRLRVRGIGRLRVADASIMPNIVGANTNAATIMIGEKASDLIAADA